MKGKWSRLKDKAGESLWLWRLERMESMIYRNKHTKRLKRTMVILSILVLALVVGHLNLPEPWETLTFLPMIVLANMGADKHYDMARSFKIGWFSGRSDLLVTLDNHVRSDVEVDWMIQAMREAAERETFAAEDLGLDKRSLRVLDGEGTDGD